MGYIVDDADDGVVDRNKGGGESERGLAAGDEKHQLAGAGLGGGVRGDDRIAGGLLLLVQGLDDQQLDA